jgi:hypothetical protein
LAGDLKLHCTAGTFSIVGWSSFHILDENCHFTRHGGTKPIRGLVL